MAVEVVVGVIGRPHGIRGELGIDVRTDEPAIRFAAGTRLYAEGSPHRSWQVASHRWHNGRLLVRLDGVPDRSAAEALRGIRLATQVSTTQVPDDDAEFYDHQLVGLTVADHTGRAVGEVAEVLHLPAHDLLAVDMADTGERRLVPFAEAVVPEVDLAAGRVVLADVPGLLTDVDDGDGVDEGDGADGGRNDRGTPR